MRPRACWSLAQMVTVIKALNRAWKSQRDRRGPRHPIVTALRDQKTSLQLTLIQEHPERIRLVPHSTADATEPLFSVRLEPPLTTAKGTFLDADHIPSRRVAEFLPELSPREAT